MRDTPIDVEPETFDAASKVVGQDMAGQLSDAVAGLEHGLADTAAMAGSDPGGLHWALAYDQAASATAGAVTDLTNACYKIAAMLEQTGFNHGAADDASNPRGTGATGPDTTTYDPRPTGTPTPPPSARGGDGAPPSGWGLIQHAVGYVWPNGDTGKLHVAAQAWSAAAGTVDGANRSFPEAIEAIRSQQSPEVDDAATVCQTMSQHIEDTAASCRELATACTDYANQLDKAHQDVENELANLVASTAVIEGVGVVATEVAGEIWAQGIEAGRVAAAATRVGEILGPLADMVTTAAESVATIISKVAQVAQRLKVILSAQITRATAAVVERLPGVAEDAETTAMEDLESSAESVPGQTGGSMRPPDDGSLRSYLRNDQWADEAYASIRQTNDVDAVSTHVADVPRVGGGRGFTPDEIAQIKNHVFEEQHPLEAIDGGTTMARFDPNPDMAEAWLRLRSGTQRPEDVTLLEHELAESRYWQEHPNASYQEAHDFANQTANWDRIKPPPSNEDYTKPWR